MKSVVTAFRPSLTTASRRIFPQVGRRITVVCGLFALVAAAQAQAQTPPHDVMLDAATNVVFGHSLNVIGAVAPAEPGLTVTVEQKSGGVWTAVATATTDATGVYGTSFAPRPADRFAPASTTGVSARSNLSRFVRLCPSRSVLRAPSWEPTSQPRSNRQRTRPDCASRYAPRAACSRAHRRACSPVSCRSGFQLPGRAGCASS
jgi:hypothetical protein